MQTSNFVAAVNAPLFVDLISCCWPVMSEALLSSSYIQHVDTDLANDAYSNNADDDSGNKTLLHD